MLERMEGKEGSERKAKNDSEKEKEKLRMIVRK